jgi:hypothetical protein
MKNEKRCSCPPSNQLSAALHITNSLASPRKETVLLHVRQTLSVRITLHDKASGGQERQIMGIGRCDEQTYVSCSVRLPSNRTHHHFTNGAVTLRVDAQQFKRILENGLSIRAAWRPCLMENKNPGECITSPNSHHDLLKKCNTRRHRSCSHTSGGQSKTSAPMTDAFICPNSAQEGKPYMPGRLSQNACRASSCVFRSTLRHVEHRFRSDSQASSFQM